MVMELSYLKPYALSSENNIQVIEEVLIWLFCYHLICQTEFVQSLEVKEYLGWGMVFHVGLYLTMSFVSLIY